MKIRHKIFADTVSQTDVDKRTEVLLKDLLSTRGFFFVTDAYFCCTV